MVRYICTCISKPFLNHSLQGYLKVTVMVLGPGDEAPVSEKYNGFLDVMTVMLAR